MPRPNKESIAVNIKMEKEIALLLEDYSIESGIPKTTIIERAVKEYIEKRQSE